MARGIFVAARRIFVGTCGIFHFGARALLCGVGFSLVACGLCSLRRSGSVVATRGLSCPMACGILVRQPGLEPASPTLEGGFLTTGPPGKSLSVVFEVSYKYAYDVKFSIGGQISKVVVMRLFKRWYLKNKYQL